MPYPGSEVSAVPLFVPGTRDDHLVGEAVMEVDVGGVAAHVIRVLMKNKEHLLDFLTPSPMSNTESRDLSPFSLVFWYTPPPHPRWTSYVTLL